MSFHLFFLALFSLLSNLYGGQNSYSACVKKIQDSHTIYNNSLYIPIQGDKRLVYSKQIPNGKILKQNKFLNLYIIEDKNPFAHPFDFNHKLDLGTAAVNAEKFIAGKQIKRQVGLNTLGRYTAQIQTPALITTPCCNLEGLITPEGVIDREYIEHFINEKSESYGDTGIRVQEEDECIKIVASNPYLKNNPLKRGDCVVSLDNKKLGSSAEFMEQILFSDIGSKHTISVTREGKLLVLDVEVIERTGGGEISDTFLEFLGLNFNKKLFIVKLNQHFKEYGLLLGDRLIQVDGLTIKNQEQLRLYIQEHKDFSRLLFERNNFQFFVNIK